MFTVSPEELQSILGQLQQAMANHEEWFAQLIRSLVCDLPHDPDNLREDAHHHCRFGRWLYHETNPRLRQHPAFDTIEVIHRLMHQSAARLLTASMENRAIHESEYDRFADSLRELRFQMGSLSRELQESLYNLDPLTGANTRIGMLSKLREQHELSRRSVQYAVIAMMDMDHFKNINDLYGHQVGDKVLTRCVHYLLDNLRVYDKVFRYGGEEFLIVMPATNVSTAMQIAQRMADGIAGIEVSLTEGGLVSCTASFGLVPLAPDITVEQSLAHADRALYAAKQAGRNCVRLWDESMTTFPSSAPDRAT